MNKHKNPITLSILLILLITISISSLGKIIIQPSKISPQISEEYSNIFVNNNDYKSNINGNSSNFNFELKQNYINTSSVNMTTVINNNMTINVEAPTDPFFNASFSNLTVSNIKAVGTLIVVEDDPGLATNYLTVDSINEVAASFKINVPTCNLSQVKIYHTIETAGTLNVYLANASWDASNLREKPDSMRIQLNSTNYSSTDSSYAFRTYDVSNIQLNSTDTVNNTFFIIMSTSDGGFRWGYVDPSFDGEANETWSFRNIAGGGWTYQASSGYDSCDLPMIIQIDPPKSNPLPSDPWFNLRVNGTLVKDWEYKGYSGQWNSYNTYIGGSIGKIDFEFSTDWPYSSWVINETIIEYHKIVSNVTYFSAFEDSSYINWTSNLILNDFGNSSFNNYKINFSLPSTSSILRIYENNSWNPLNYSEINVVSKDIIVSIPENISSESIFYLEFQTMNLLDGIYFYSLNKSNYINSTDYLDKIIVNVKLITPTTGTLYLNIYNTSNSKISTMNATFSNTEINFSIWDIPDEEIGNYTFQIFLENNYFGIAFGCKKLNVTEIGLNSDTNSNSNTDTNSNSDTDTDTNINTETSTSTGTSTETNTNTESNNNSNDNFLIWLISGGIILGLAISISIFIILKRKKNS